MSRKTKFSWARTRRMWERGWARNRAVAPWVKRVRLQAEG